jgi:hypothetical protein
LVTRVRAGFSALFWGVSKGLLVDLSASRVLPSRYEEPPDFPTSRVAEAELELAGTTEV